jgi:hypothetical protein
MTKKNVTVSNIPMVGIGATISFHSDRVATTLIQVTHKGKRLVLQRDKATRTDHNGMSESQNYNYERDENGQIYTATYREDGSYRLTGGTERVSLGVRREWYDFSF